jgi:hypothetical protein
MATVKTFISCYPPEYMTEESYRNLGGKYPNEKVQGHLFKELCCVCGKPASTHFGGLLNNGALTCKPETSDQK